MSARGKKKQKWKPGQAVDANDEEVDHTTFQSLVKQKEEEHKEQSEVS